VCDMPAVVIPAGNGLVTITPEIAGAECPTDDGSDLERFSSERGALEAMANVREFAYDDWMREVFQGCVDKGPPLALVAARTFVDMITGQILTLDGIEQYWVPYVLAPDA
jgi:hypothetical protein